MKLPFVQMGARQIECEATAAAGGGSGNIQTENKKLRLMSRMWSLPFLVFSRWMRWSQYGVKYLETQWVTFVGWPDVRAAVENRVERTQTQDLIQAREAFNRAS